MGTVLDHHVAAALLADLVGHLVLDRDLLELSARPLDGLVQVRVEVLDDGLPLHGAICHTVEKRLQVRRKARIHDGGELLLHDPVDGLAELGHVQVFVLLRHVVAGENRRDGRRVGRGAADSLLLEGMHQRCLCVVGNGLGEVLLCIQLLQGKLCVLRDAVSLRGALLVVICRRIDLEEAVEGDPRAGEREQVLRAVCRLCRDPHLCCLDLCPCHAACHKALPDQAVEPVLVAVEGVLDGLGGPCDVRRADCLVGILDLRRGLLLLQRTEVILPVVLLNVVRRCRHGLLGDARRVGTQVGDDTHGPLSLDLDALIELLGDAHGLLR